MKFWGVEVKAGEPVTVTPDVDFVVHLSQAALGESKKVKGSDSVPLFVKIDGKKLVLGTLSPKKIPQLAFDLAFEREFELSHNWKNGSVYFTGYKSFLPNEEYPFFSTASYDMLLMGFLYRKVEKTKPVAAAKAASAKLESESDDFDSSDDSDDSDSSNDSDSSDSSDDSDEESDEEETWTELCKKRANDSALRTPVPNKKPKQSTLQKTGKVEKPKPVATAKAAFAKLESESDDSDSSNDSDSSDSSDDSDEESDEEETQTELNKKRANESALGALVPNKKPKQSTPQKTGKVEKPKPVAAAKAASDSSEDSDDSDSDDSDSSDDSESGLKKERKPAPKLSKIEKIQQSIDRRGSGNE
ncbi:Histone deacetylase HDT1 [Linum perenne]